MQENTSVLKLNQPNLIDVSLQSVIDGLNEPVFICGTDLSLIHSNQSAKRLMQETANLLQNIPIHLYFKNGKAVLDTIVKRTLSQSGIIPGKIELIGEDGPQARKFRIHSSMLKQDNTTQPVGVMLRLTEYSTTKSFRFQDLQNHSEKIKTELEVQRRLASIDPLTGLANRRYFLNRCEQLIYQSSSEVIGASILLIDLDYFKQINDNHGHPFGDWVLTRISQIIKENCRKQDIPCRWGGEEFIILMPELSDNDGLAIAQRLIGAIEREAFKSKESLVSVTASAGLAKISQDEDLVSIIDRCDRALYQAKDLGRNQVVKAML